MRLTIITPSFNQAQYIEQTIESVLSQNYSDLEYIVIDGGSTDGSLDIIKKHEKHLTYWVSEPDRGQSHAINKGLQLATGEVVNWLNSDDYYESNALNTIAEAFANPNINAVCARSNIVRNESIVQQSNGTDIYINNLAKTIGWARIDQPETFFRKSSYEKIGGLNEGLHYIMDKEWWIRYLFAFGLEGIKQIDDRIVNFRLHDQSKTESKKKQFEYENDQLYWSLAKQAGLININSFLEETILHQKPISPTQLWFPSVELVEQIIHYYLLLKADQQYYQLNLNTARKILGQIKPEYLGVEDQRLMKKLSFRAKYLPAPFVKIIRQWK
ncbi:MAG: glycosyltransferase [Bacteroidetes bacterium]|nr:glycosyltransferase [Bacteroidota bacterium]